ncbi:MAG: choice-of-anchor T family protein [Thermoplasmatota archaeon]
MKAYGVPVPFFFIFLIGTLSIFYVTLRADAQDPNTTLEDPNIWIKMDEYEKSVNVAPGEDGIVTFNGSVGIQFPNGTPENEICIVDLICECDGWPVSKPPILPFSLKSPEKEFKTSIQVPITTSSKVKNELVITARWSYDPDYRYGELEPVNCTVIVLPYADIKIGCDRPYQETDIGEWVIFRMNIRNEGNYDAVVDIEAVPDRDNLEIEPMNLTIEVPEGETVVFSVRIRQKEGLSRVGYIEMSAKCDIHSDEEPWTYSLYLRSNPTLASIVDEVWFYPLSIGLAAVLVTAAFIAILIKVILWRTRK